MKNVEIETQVKDKNFFYFIKKGKFTICDPEFCAQSKNTFDLSFFDIANNEKLLDLLCLYYIHGNYGVSYNYHGRAKWFCGYICAFYEHDEGRYDKLLTNPKVRLLIQDNALLQKVNLVINQ